MSDTEGPGFEDLMRMSKKVLVGTTLTGIRQVAQLNRELAVAEWQAGLLAAQRDRLLEHLVSEPLHVCSGERWCQVCIFREEAYDIMITDPRDEGTP